MLFFSFRPETRLLSLEFNSGKFGAALPTSLFPIHGGTVVHRARPSTVYARGNVITHADVMFGDYRIIFGGFPYKP